MKKQNIIIAGCGGIGNAVGLILAVSQEMPVQLYMGDINQEAINSAVRFVQEGSGEHDIVSGFQMPLSGTDEAMDAILEKGDIILDCLPGSQAPRMAQLAKDNHMHYVNLTEYVAETNEIMALAKDAETGFVLQTGVAPGFVNILGHQLYQQFQELYHTDELDLLEMKVGALSQNASSPHFYAFTWSPIGVATEYVKEAVIVQDHAITKVPSLSELTELIVDGVRYEDNFTSGGAADLPQAFHSKIRDIHYKTIRYPGHYAWVGKQLEKLKNQEQLTQSLEKIMLEEIPSVENDVIIIYCRVKGKDNTGRLRAINKVVHVYPKQIGKKTLRAIQSTTAAPMCECARMLLQGEMKPGINLQSEIDPTSFIHGPYIQMIYGDLA